MHAYGTSIEIFVTYLRVHGRLMTYELPLQTSRTYPCAIVHTRYEYTNIRYVLSCGRKIDDVRTYVLICVNLKQS